MSQPPQRNQPRLRGKLEFGPDLFVREEVWVFLRSLSTRQRGQCIRDLVQYAVLMLMDRKEEAAVLAPALPGLVLEKPGAPATPDLRVPTETCPPPKPVPVAPALPAPGRGFRTPHVDPVIALARGWCASSGDVVEDGDA